LEFKFNQGNVLQRAEAGKVQARLPASHISREHREARIALSFPGSLPAGESQKKIRIQRRAIKPSLVGLSHAAP
jgi:hypothetical protein